MLLNSRCAEFLILVCCLVILGVQRCRCWKLRHQVISESKQRFLLDHKGLYVLPSFMVIINYMGSRYFWIPINKSVCRAWMWHRYRLLVLNQIPQDADPSDPLAYASWMKCRMKLCVHDTWYLIQIVLVFGVSNAFHLPWPTVHSCLYINSISRWTGIFQVSQERLEENVDFCHLSKVFKARQLHEGNRGRLWRPRPDPPRVERRKGGACSAELAAVQRQWTWMMEGSSHENLWNHGLC